MKPTNHLRWIERSVKYTTPRIKFPGFGFFSSSVIEPKESERTDTILQQFWDMSDMSIDDWRPRSVVPFNGMIGEWRDIPTVKS